MRNIVVAMMGLTLLTLVGCADVTATDIPQLTVQNVPYGQTIRGADISTLKKVEDNGGTFYDKGKRKDPLVILRRHGVNYVRLKIWKDPVDVDGYNDLSQTVELELLGRPRTPRQTYGVGRT